ncbi:MAG TPA: hypothetical protein VGJ60_07120 [Chloroflexota bacterium]|jgi:hypothetical protein
MTPATETSIDALALHCGKCGQRRQAVVLAMYEGLCRRCHERAQRTLCGACHNDARPEVLWRFGGVCRACHFRGRYPAGGPTLAEFRAQSGCVHDQAEVA